MTNIFCKVLEQAQEGLLATGIPRLEKSKYYNIFFIIIFFYRKMNNEQPINSNVRPKSVFWHAIHYQTQLLFFVWWIFHQQCYLQALAFSTSSELLYIHLRQNHTKSIGVLNFFEILYFWFSNLFFVVFMVQLLLKIK